MGRSKKRVGVKELPDFCPHHMTLNTSTSKYDLTSHMIVMKNCQALRQGRSATERRQSCIFSECRVIVEEGRVILFFSFHRPRVGLKFVDF